MKDEHFDLYWSDIPVGAENAVTYDDLMKWWGKEKRTVRAILHKLSTVDNGDNYVLIRSGHGIGFYKTDDEETIKAYKKECLNKGRSNFATIEKINRILKWNDNELQQSVFNNIKAIRLSKGMSQPTVCKLMSKYGCSIDPPTLSKMENGVFLPTPHQLSIMAKIFGVYPFEIVNISLSHLDIYAPYSAKK